MILNVHERVLAADAADAAFLLDDLASPGDSASWTCPGLEGHHRFELESAGPRVAWGGAR